MHFDMETWQEKDLGWIARKMDGIQRRLALGRGGKQTRKMQREVLVRLEEMIKEMERPTPPGPETPGTPRPGDRVKPPTDTPGARPMDGKGDIEERQRQLVEWIIKLPEKERARVRAELLKDMPAGDRAVIERYFKELQRGKR
jgi:hypothetical protein